MTGLGGRVSAESWRIWRDIIVCLTGIGLIIYEAVIHTGPTRYELLVLYAGMIGLPAVLRVDQRRAGNPDRETADDHP